MQHDPDEAQAGGTQSGAAGPAPPTGSLPTAQPTFTAVGDLLGRPCISVPQSARVQWDAGSTLKTNQFQSKFGRPTPPPGHVVGRSAIGRKVLSSSACFSDRNAFVIIG